MKIVLTEFVPILVAIGVRVVLALAGLILALPWLLFDVMDNLGEFAKVIGDFDTFNWNESWGYWILVIIGSFMAEMVIWQDD